MPTKEEQKAFDSTLYYHGNKVAPYDLRNHRLEPTVSIQEAPPDWKGTDKDWENWDHFVKRGSVHKGFFVTQSKTHASYFATQWGKGKSGYVYSFDKPKNIKRALGIPDPEDRQFVSHPITPKYVQEVSIKRTKPGINGPHNFKSTDYVYGKRKSFDEAIKGHTMVQDATKKQPKEVRQVRIGRVLLKNR